MGKGKLSVELNGQMVFDFSFDDGNYVVQSNMMIEAKQQLGLTAAKIMRMAIMQIQPEDKVFKPYVVSIKQLSKMFGIDSSNLYRDIDKISDELTGTIQFKTESKSKDPWAKIPITSICCYDPEKGFAIQLNERLKPYLLGLKQQYSQIEDAEYNNFTSVYGLRIFEIILSRIYMKVLPEEGTHVDIPIQLIKEATDTEKYTDSTDFKRKVLDIAVANINQNTSYRVSYERLKVNSGKYDTVRFFVNIWYHPDKYLPTNK